MTHADGSTFTNHHHRCSHHRYDQHYYRRRLQYRHQLYRHRQEKVRLFHLLKLPVLG